MHDYLSYRQQGTVWGSSWVNTGTSLLTFFYLICIFILIDIDIANLVDGSIPYISDKKEIL